MKEAFWGVLILSLGLLGIVIINVFQEVTVGNDEVYYVLKETSEASMLDGIDLAYYRLTGNIRVVEDKVVENFTRRFAENITNKRNYKITIHDINEVPPKMSVTVEVGINFQGKTYGITNKVNAIIETKYDLDKFLEFLDITEEEWNSKIELNEKGDKDKCLITTLGSSEYECMPGDIEFVEWEDIALPEKVCQTETLSKKTREARYRVCNCGKWEEKAEEITSTPVNNVYTWSLKKEGEIRTIEESITKRVIRDVCTTGINIMVPKDLTKKEPSDDNKEYTICSGSGIRIPVGSELILHGEYIPTDATNRNIIWTNKDSTYLTLIEPLNSIIIGSKGYSKAGIIAKDIGTTTITAKTTLNQAATCKVEIFEGVDSVGCEAMTLDVNETATLKTTYTPYNAKDTKFTYKIKDTSIATIDEEGKVRGKKGGNTTITVTSTNGKTGTCNIKVNKPSGGGTAIGGECTISYSEEIELLGFEQDVFFLNCDKCGCKQYKACDCCIKWGAYNVILDKKECLKYRNNCTSTSCGCETCNSCRANNEEKPITKSATVVYNGNIETESYKYLFGLCTKITKYCVFTRSKNYKNPSEKGKTVISTNIQCLEVKNDYE